MKCQTKPERKVLPSSSNVPVFLLNQLGNARASGEAARETGPEISFSLPHSRHGFASLKTFNVITSKSHVISSEVLFFNRNEKKWLRKKA